MDLWRIAVRALVAYVYLLFTTRASGKRTVMQATPFDLVISIVLGDVIDDVLWAEVSVAKFATATATIVLCDGLVALGAYHWQWFFRLVNGAPTVVLRDGVEDGHALRREQLNEGDLAHLLRLQGIDDWSKVRLALIERDHEASSILEPEYEPAQKQDAERLPP